MLRSEVIQAVADLYTKANYLEIGVNAGETFHQVKALRKVAVDPVFAFDVINYRNANKNCLYYEVTSNHFFDNFVGLHEKFDVVFIDGLHTFEQTLMDLLNSIVHLEKDGVIIIDDVRPISYSSSIRTVADSQMVKRLIPYERDGAWMGDVYRLVFFIETFMRAFSYASVQENNSHQLILWRQKRAESMGCDRTVESIARLEFSHVLALQESYRTIPLSEIISAIKKARSGQTT
jgi:hypothetical protein